jgi:hypothetical protein
MLHSRVRLWLSFVIVLILSACGASAEPADPLDRVSFGIDMHDEAREVERATEREGYALDVRLDSRAFVAFDARNSARESRVRVVTSRGLVVAVDAGPAMPLERAELYNVPRTPDSPELIVRVREAGHAYDCYRIFVIDGEGRSHELRVREVGLDQCVRRVEDIDGDGALEAIGAEPLPSPSPLVPPARVPVPLAAREGALVVADGRGSADILERLAQEERLALLDARARNDARQALRLGLVLGRIAHHGGASPEECARVFDAAVDALVFTDVENDARQSFREFVLSWAL